MQSRLARRYVRMVTTKRHELYFISKGRIFFMEVGRKEEILKLPEGWQNIEERR